MPSTSNPSPVLLPGQPLPASYQPPRRSNGQVIQGTLKSITGRGNLTPGHGVYSDIESGVFRASITGRPEKVGDQVIIRQLTGKGQSAVPEIGKVVIGTISRLTPQQATLSISLVSQLPTPSSQEEYQGVIRVQDIRLTERDKLKMAECFRLGDVVKAEVISLGDARSYFLSTAKNELGVVAAISEAGNPLRPLSWSEMIDDETGRIEKRKVAKPET